MTDLVLTGPVEIRDGEVPLRELHVDHPALGIVARVRVDALAPGVDARAVGAALAAVLKPYVVEE